MASWLLAMLGLRSVESTCLQQVTHAVAECLAGPWTPVPWWMLPFFYLLGVVTSNFCKRRLHRATVAGIKTFEPKRGRPLVEARKKAELAASALDFGDKPGAKRFLYEALSLVDS